VRTYPISGKNRLDRNALPYSYKRITLVMDPIIRKNRTMLIQDFVFIEGVGS